MFYIFNFKKMKGIAVFTLTVALVVLTCRYIILPKYVFPRNFSDYVEKYALKYHLDVNLVYSVIRVESNFDSNALSRKEAKGLMQVSDVTGEWGASEIGMESFQKELLYEPDVNIELGCWYLDRLINQYPKKVDTALAAYNAGSGNVSKWLKDAQYSSDGETLDKIPFPETSNYVKKVNFVKKMYDMLY